MNVRELLTDAPALDVLLERCMSQPYELDPFDFFYMQALNEQNKERHPASSWGFRKGVTVAVGGGLAQQELSRLGYSPAILSINKQLVTTVLGEELTGDLDLDLFVEQGALLKEANPALSSSLAPLNKQWNQLGKAYLDLCKQSSPEIYRNVNFSSPVFKGTKRFESFVRKRRLSDDDITRLESFYADTGHPFEVIRLPYFSLHTPLFKK